jgi:hypothetical protein
LVEPEIPPRLPFALPDFTRVSWVNDTVHDTWGPRLARVNRAWSELEWASTATGLRRCALLWRSPSDRDAHVEQWRKCRLSALSLSNAHQPPTTGDHGVQENAQENRTNIPDPSRNSAGQNLTITVVGRQLDDLHAFQHAWHSHDHDVIGSLLGYPDCCRLMFGAFWSTGATDPTWPMACATEHAQRNGLTVTVGGQDNANILWRWLGIRTVAHLPCSFTCPQTAQIGERNLELGHNAGLVQEIAWLRELLSWPVEYSALHGIAEIKTPILRVATRTDATAEKYIVRRDGTGFPEDGAHGLRFPYRAPVPLTLRQRKPATSTPVSNAATKKAKWYFSDNGFTSAQAMTKAHRPLVELAQQVLQTQAGNILDLGSGNGALLAAIQSRCPAVHPVGVEINPTAVAHAATVLQHPPGANKNQTIGQIRQGDLFDTTTWGDRDYALAILMLGRLAEHQNIADTFLQTLGQRCATLLVYLYGDWAQHSLKELAATNHLTLDPTHHTHTADVQAGIVDLSAWRSDK